MLKELTTSKKFWMTVLGMLGINAAWAETHSTTLVVAVAVLQAVYLFAQGLADHGKSAAQIHSGQAIAGVAEAVKSKIAEGATATVPPVVGVLAFCAGLAAFSLGAWSCTPAEIKASPVAHEIKSTTDLAGALCEQSPEMLAEAKVKGLSVKDVCAGIEVLQPWVDTLLAAERDGEQKAAQRRAARQCLPIKETAP